MPVISLLTDFGGVDEYVGVMKGVILTINPKATIVDISHRVDAQDVVQAAYTIEASYRYFPRGAIHLIVVDPGVGTDRRIVALEARGQVFLAPDNGVLTPVIDKADADTVVRVENSGYFLDTVSRTFHGRDIFAPVGAHLSLGVGINSLGPPVDPADLVRLGLPEPYMSDRGELVGTIVSVDRFGNLITNIDRRSIDRLTQGKGDDRLGVQTGDNIINGLSQSYESAGKGGPLAIIGSREYLELAVNLGSAKTVLRVEKGDTVRLRLMNDG
jgi:S-adenosylmethionine hydrolase